MLPGPRRALTPGPSLYLDERSWPHATAHMDAFDLPIGSHTLLNVIPGLARRRGNYSYDDSSIVDQLIADSPEMWPRTRWNYLTVEDFSRVYQWILKAQMRCPHGETDMMLSEGILDGLERSYQHDQNDARAGTPGEYFHRRSQRLFRTLADVSRQTDSSTIGHVLGRWFASRATHIAANDNITALGQWCYAIIQAAQHEADRRDCLLKVFRIRPELSALLTGKGAKSEIVLRHLQTIERMSLRRHVGLRIETPYPGRAQGDDMMFGRSLLSNVRNPLLRSRSHDGILLSSLRDLIGRSTLRDLDGREFAGRAMLEREGLARQHDRLLQLNQDRRYRDRLGLLDGLTLDDFDLERRSGLRDEGLDDLTFI